MVTQGLRSFFVPVCRQIVEDHDSAGRNFRHQYLTDVSSKGCSIHCPFDDPWRDERVLCQACNQRLSSPTAKGRIHVQAVTPFGPAVQTGEVRLHGGFVNEHYTFWQFRNGRKAMSEPVCALLLYLCATAFGGNQRLFLYVNPRRESRFAMDE